MQVIAFEDERWQGKGTHWRLHSLTRGALTAEVQERVPEGWLVTSVDVTVSDDGIVVLESTRPFAGRILVHS